MEGINLRIKQEVCYKTIEDLSDSNLIPYYRNCNSVKNKTKELQNTLIKYNVYKTKVQEILQDYSLNLIPPGTKGVIRGNRFNSIVKNFINNLSLDTNRFEICFEKKCENHFTTEIPDWFILEKFVEWRSAT
jgi:hypothetical protein